jgi:hypothetical protein
LRTLDVPARGPALAVGFDRDRVVIAAGDRVVWVR